MNVATVITIAYGLVYGLLALAVWRVRRPRRPALEARIAAARERTRAAAPVVDTEHGIDLALSDECELLYSLPAYGTELDLQFRRLQQAIYDDQEKGEQP